MAFKGAQQRRIVGGVAAVALALGVAWFVFRGGAREPLTEREIAVRVMAEYLERAVKPISTVLISNPFAQTKGRPAEVYQFQNAAEAGLRKGLGAGRKIAVAFPRLRPEAIAKPESVVVPPNTRTPLSFFVAENGFDEVIAQPGDCDLVVSVIGMPVNVGAVTAWGKPGSPRFALLLPDFKLLGGPEPVRHAFKSGKLAAAIVAKPVAPQSSAAKLGDYQAEFEKRFVLVTSENVDQLLPLLFK